MFSLAVSDSSLQLNEHSQSAPAERAVVSAQTRPPAHRPGGEPRHPVLALENLCALQTRALLSQENQRIGREY